MYRAIGVACLLAVVLGGCRDGGTANPTTTIEPRSTASSPSPRATTSGSDACTLLTSRERSSIAGQALDTVSPAPVMQDVLQCRWVKTLSAPAAVSLNVESSLAEKWAQDLPKVVDAAMVSGRVDGKLLKRLQAARKQVVKRGAELGGGEACDMFSLVLEANSGRQGARMHVYTQPTESGEILAVAQKCARGVYMSLTYSEPNLQQSYPLGQAMLRLITIAHKRAVKIL